MNDFDKYLAGLPGGARAAAVMALLVGGFGWQFAVTNPLIATRLFHLDSAGFGLFGTCAACGRDRRELLVLAPRGPRPA